MQQIRKDIENNKIGSLYLLYGEEDYLRKKLRDELKQAVIGAEPSLNYAYFEGKSVEVQEVIAFADTIPFLAERRLVIVENCVLNAKAPEEWLDYLSHVNPATCVVLVEASVDKRSRFYKTCKKYGCVADLDFQKEAALMQWVTQWLEENHCTMSRENIQYFLGRVSNHMGVIEKELEKLRDYSLAWEEDGSLSQKPQEISRETIDMLSVETIEDKIFVMVDAATQGEQRKAFDLYYDLVALKKAPLQILAMLNRQVNILLQLKDHLRLKHSSGEAAKAIGVAPFVVGKNTPAAKKLTYKKLKYLLEFGTQMEEDAKLGRIKDAMAVELLLTECCREQ